MNKMDDGVQFRVWLKGENRSGKWNSVNLDHHASVDAAKEYIKRGGFRNQHPLRGKITWTVFMGRV